MHEWADESTIYLLAKVLEAVLLFLAVQQLPTSMQQLRASLGKPIAQLDGLA